MYIILILKQRQLLQQNLPINELGFDIPSIDDTIDKLNETSEDLFYAIKYGEDE